jgi:hypothetical protein
MGNKNAPTREWYAQSRTAACDLVRLNLIGVDCMPELRPLNGISDLDWPKIGIALRRPGTRIIRAASGVSVIEIIRYF